MLHHLALAAWKVIVSPSTFMLDFTEGITLAMNALNRTTQPLAAAPLDLDQALREY
jgi:hypothetical protein